MVVLLLASVWAMHMHQIARHFADPDHRETISKFPWIATFEGDGYWHLTLVLAIIAPLAVTMTGPLVEFVGEACRRMPAPVPSR